MDGYTGWMSDATGIKDENATAHVGLFIETSTMTIVAGQVRHPEVVTIARKTAEFNKHVVGAVTEFEGIIGDGW